MKVFEFHFKDKENKSEIFDTFCYEAENILERKLGNLFMVGSVNNNSSKNSGLLNDITRNIKQRYYESYMLSIENSFKESIKKANQCIQEIIKEGNDDWLTNFNFAILSILIKKTNSWAINFTKIGKTKIFLLRSGKITDIGKELKFNNAKPDQMKVFSNIASGILIEDDIVLVLSHSLLDFFEKYKLIEEIAQLKTYDLYEERIKNLFDKSRKKTPDVIGACLLIHLSKKTSGFEPTNPPLTLQNKIPSFPYNLLNKFQLFKIPKIKISLPFSIPLKFKENIKFKNRINKKILLIISLIIFLILGYFIINKQNQNKNLPDNRTEEENIEELYRINKLEEIKDPELFFEFSQEFFTPEKMISLNNQLLFFNKESENIISLNPENKELEIKKGFNIPYDNINLSDLSLYNDNLYFIDRENNRITKYPYVNSSTWGNAQLWFSFDESQKTIDNVKSMAIDGSIWLFNKDNSIDRYHNNKYQETLEMKIFPFPLNISKIFTAYNFSNLYLLEPDQNRIIILNKQGKIVKQYQSDKFNQLLDLTVSDQENTIFILNEYKLYRIELDF